MYDDFKSYDQDFYRSLGAILGITSILYILRISGKKIPMTHSYVINKNYFDLMEKNHAADNTGDKEDDRG